MILTNEYLNLLKTDLRKVLDTTVIDRDRLLSAIIEEYEYKYEDATLQISILSEIKD
ncbi:MAG: hypothetical protein P1U46_04630 [Patescibacteria group bacterium]|nr:hypothetical protein [Patescibacteria group bacterium]